ncbi:hypothetical protein ACVGWV_11395, partial [Enterobacter asburiae]
PPPRFFIYRATTYFYNNRGWWAGSFVYKRQAFDALVLFSTCFPIGLMVVFFGSRPVGRFIRK